MTLPNFLIIGAMKAGTTTLYEDLRRTPGVYMPPEKEPNDLASPNVETPQGLAAYQRKFRSAGRARAVGEASTAYTKRPRFEGSAERAVRILGPGIKVIYMVREPIHRAVSQYHYELGAGLVTAGLNEALLNEPRFMAYSRYSYQLAAWRAVLPPEQILLVNFERYLKERHAQVGRIRAFLGLAEPFTVEETQRNASAGRAVVPRSGMMRTLVGSRAYLYGVKQLLPENLRDRVKALLLPKAPHSIEALVPTTAEALQGLLSGEDMALYRSTLSSSDVPS